MSHILSRNLPAVYRAQTFDGGPLVDAAGHVRPHGYMPDSQAMGDCLYCGNVADASCHRRPWQDGEPSVASIYHPTTPAVDARPDQYARRNGHPTGGVPQPVMLDEVRGQTLEPLADAEGTGLLGPESLSLGMLAAGSPYIPDVADYVPPAIAADWLSDAGRCELDAVRGLLSRMARECPGVNVRVAVSFGVSRLADGTDHVDHCPGWELTAWRGTQRYNGSGQDLERLAGICAARFAGKAVPT